MTIYDISREAGVSIATVSRVLNGGRSVSEKTRRRVLEAIEKSGYTPNAFARGLGLNSMRTVGLCCAGVDDPFIAASVSEIEGRLRAQGYNLLLCCTGYEYGARRRNVKSLLDKRPDGLILVGSHYVENDGAQNDYLRDAALRAPVMLIHGALEAENVYCALCDDTRAMFMAAQFLSGRGARRILYLYGADTFAGVRKKNGYSQAVEQAGARPALCRCPHPGDVADSARRIEQARRAYPNFDAILAETDTLAIAAMKYANARGLNVPGQLQILGYNDSRLCQYSTPELSSVNSAQADICAYCAGSLIAVLGGEKRPAQAIFPAAITARGSTR